MRPRIAATIAIFGLIGTLLGCFQFVFSSSPEDAVEPIRAKQEAHSKEHHAHTVQLAALRADVEAQHADQLADKDRIIALLEEKLATLNIDPKARQRAQDAVEQGDYAEADAIFKELRAPDEKSQQEMAERANAHGDVLLLALKYQEALEAYKEATRLQPGNASYWLDYGKALYTLAQYDDAVECVETALALFREKHGERHGDVAVCLNNLGASWRAKGEYDKAITYYAQALDIDKEYYGERHPKVAICLNNLGGAWDSKGEYDKAIEYYAQALDIDKEYYGERHPQVAIYLNNLGLAWKAKGEYDKAIEYYEQALDIDKEYFGERHPKVAIRLNNLGGAWDSKGEYDKAITYFAQALDIFQEFLGDGHPYTVAVKRHITAARADAAK